MSEQERSKQIGVADDKNEETQAQENGTEGVTNTLEETAEPKKTAAEKAEETDATEMEQDETGADESEENKPRADQGDETEQDTRDRLFTLRFKIPLEDYLTFYRMMTSGDEKKNKKKMTIVGAVEIVVGIIYLIMALTGVTESSIFTYVVCLMLLLMGVYGMTYYKYFYQGSLTRSVTKQYDKTPYFHSTMTIDFYPNRSVEHIGDQLVENLWSRIDSIKVSESAYMIMVDPKRCMLIPKGQIVGQTERMDALVELICENYEKKRYEV